MKVHEFYAALFKYQKKYPFLFSTVVVCNILTSLCEGALPFLVKILFDSMSGIKQSYGFQTIFILLVLNFLILTVGCVCQKNIVAKLGANITGDLRFLILKKIQLGKSNSKGGIEGGQVITNFTSSMMLLESTISFNIWKYFGLSVVIIISGVTLVYFEWHMSLIVFFCMAAMYKIPNYFSRKAAYYANLKKESEWALVDNIQEELTLQKVIRIFLLTEFRQKLFEKLLRTSKKYNFRYGANLGLVGNSAFLSTYFVRVLILIVGVYLVGAKYLTLIELTGFYLALGNFSSAISSLSNTHASIAQGAECLVQIEDMLKEPVVVDEPKRDIVLPPFSRNIVFKDVFFKYEEQYALSNINLEIQAGQSVAFVGPSGSGKSTMLSLLLGDNQVTQGKILIDGINLNSIYLPSILKQIGVIYQNSLLFHTTIAENIRMGKQTATNDEIIAAAKQAELHDDITHLQLGYDTIIGKQNQSLSGGQCQRIAIARALISKPAILYLDEATSALDPLSSDAIDKTLEKMTGSRTLISVTHRLKSAENADQIIVMEKGKIVERGTHTELLAKQGLYTQLWEKQHGVILSQDKTEGTVNLLWFKFVPLFSSLSPEVLELIGNEFEIETIAENTVIFNEGDPGNKFYVVAAGIVSVSRRNKVTNQNESITTLVDGDFFGEIALLRDEPRNASIQTLSVCIFMTITAKRFHKIFMKLPEDVRKTIFEKALEREDV